MRLRSFARRVRKALQLLAYFYHVPDPYWVRQLASRGIPSHVVQWLPCQRSVLVKELGLRLMPRHAFVLSALDSVRLLQGIDATFAVDPVGTLRCKMGDEQYFVTSEEELRILVEIWVLGTYNYFLSGPSIIVDIGMNVGLASLFFARCTDCIIYGFEPVQETYEAALRNFALNCGPAARIKSHNFGLGSENRRARFAFNLAWKGLAGIRSALPRTQSVDSISYRDVEIRNVNEVLGEIIAAHLDHTLVLKVDCEGGNTRSSTLFIKRDCSIRSTC